MINQKISSNLQGFPMLKSPNLDIKDDYECVLSKYPEKNAILITNNTISLLDSQTDIILDEKKFNWLLNCSGFALRIDDLVDTSTAQNIPNQKSIFKTALGLYLKWIVCNPIQHLLDREKLEKYFQLFLIHISQIFLNPSFTFVFLDFIKRMNEIFIKTHPLLSEETWSILIKVLLCGTLDFATSTKNVKFTELAILAFDILLKSTFKSQSFLNQFNSLIHKLFSFPSFSQEVWLRLFVKVYNPIVKSYFLSIVPARFRANSRRSNKDSNSSQSSDNEVRTSNKSKNRKESDAEKVQIKKMNKQLIFEFIIEKINQEFSKEFKQEAFSKAIHCWDMVSKNVRFPVHPKWPTDEIKSLFLNWFSIDCKWTNPPSHPLFTLIMRGERETTLELQEIAKNLIINVLENTTIDHETDLFWYLPVYAYDFLMNNLTFLDSLELSFQNFAVRFESSKMTSNFDIYQHLLFILIRLVQRTKSDDIRNTMTNLAVSSEYKNNLMLMITSILSMVVIKRGDLFWSQLNKCFSNRYSLSIAALMNKEAFSRIILIAGFVPLILRSDFSTNINIDPNFWDLLESLLNKNNFSNIYNLDSHFTSKFLNSASSSSSGSSSHSYLKSIFPIFSNNISYLETNALQSHNQSMLQLQQMNQQQQMNSGFAGNSELYNTEIRNKPQKLCNKDNNQDDFLKSIEQQKVLLGVFCLSQGTDLFTSHPEYNSRLLNLLSKPKSYQNETNPSIPNSNSFSSINQHFPSMMKANNNFPGSLNTTNPSLLNTFANMSQNAVSTINLSLMNSNNNNYNYMSNSNSFLSSNYGTNNANNIPNNQNSMMNSSNSTFTSKFINENDDFENEDVSELKIFRKMTQLSIFCGGEAYQLDTINNDMCGYTENFVTKKFILSVIGKSHIVIRHGLGINVFRVEDLGGRECYKGSLCSCEKKKLFTNENQEKVNPEEKATPSDLYVSPFDDDNDESFMNSLKEVDSMFNNNDSHANQKEGELSYPLAFQKPLERKEVSDAHSLLCDLGFISADSSMNTRHISTGCFGFLDKLDKTPPSSSVDVFIFQLLDDNDNVIIGRNKTSQTDEESKTKESSSSARDDCMHPRNPYSSLAYSLTNRGKRTKNLEELMKYLNAANDCCIANINYHMPIFDDESDTEDSIFTDFDDNKNNSEIFAGNGNENMTNTDQKRDKISDENDQKAYQQQQQNHEDEDIKGYYRSRMRHRKGTIHSISPSQANQIGFLLLLNETGMVIDPTSPELNNFECVIAITPQTRMEQPKSEKDGSDNDENEEENYIVDLISCESSFFYDNQSVKNRRFYITRPNIGWIVSLAAFLFYATPGQTMESGYTHLRSPSHFTSGYCQRSKQIRDLFDRSESGRNTILVGCLSCGIKQSQ